MLILPRSVYNKNYIKTKNYIPTYKRINELCITIILKSFNHHRSNITPHQSYAYTSFYYYYIII